MFASGCDPDPAREAVNQMHRALLPRTGADDGRLWKQTASPARTGDAYSGRRCFLFRSLSLSPFLSLPHAHTHTHTHTHIHFCSVFKQPLDHSVIYQHWRSRGDSSHYTYPPAHTHTHTHPHSQCPLHSNEVAGSQEDNFNIHTTQFRCEALHVGAHNGRWMFKSRSPLTRLVKHTLHCNTPECQSWWQVHGRRAGHPWIGKWTPSSSLHLHVK